MEKRLDSLNNPNKPQSLLNLDPRIIFFLLKYGRIAFPKITKCWSITFSLFDGILYDSTQKLKELHNIHDWNN